MPRKNIINPNRSKGEQMSETSMKGKCVLVTGASSGIGYAVAEIFAKAGAKVILCARRADKLQEATTCFSEKYQAVTYSLPIDISDQKEVFHAISQLPAEWKKIDVLINNAGVVLGLDKIADGNPDDWGKIID